MVDLSIVFCKRLPGRVNLHFPSFSYGFPMVFPLQPPFSIVFFKRLPGRVYSDTSDHQGDIITSFFGPGMIPLGS